MYDATEKHLVANPRPLGLRCLIVVEDLTSAFDLPAFFQRYLSPCPVKTMTSVAPTTPGFRVRRVFVSLSVLLILTPGFAQQTPAPAEPAPQSNDEVVVLTPFTVDASKDKGYYAENTLAGSRIRTNLGDLASAITVVTRQQLLDTGSTDVNDVFLYEANTEGTGNFTQTHGSQGMGVDRTTIKDVAAGYGWGNNPNAVYTASTANRVRGIGSPDPAQNYYPSIARIPWDSYNTASIEINRGPNSVLFGIGSPAGIVNQSTTTATINRNAGEFEARLGSWDSYRGSLSFNQTLIKDKLAVFVAALYDEKGFIRKPSEDTTRRQYATLTFKPFKRTTLRATFENYDNFSRRPNYLTPRDYVTPWYEDGRPVFDPVTRMVTYMDTGATKGPYVFSSNSPGFDPTLHVTVSGTGGSPGQLAANGTIGSADNMLVGGAGYGVNHPLYVRSLEFTDYTRAVLAVQNGEGRFIGRQVYMDNQAGFAPPAIAARTPDDWALIERRTTQSTGVRMQQPTIVNPNGTLTNQITGYVTPSVTDKSIYNWEKVNINSMNFGTSEAKTYNVELEQEVLDNLFVQVGWFHQEMEAVSNFVLGQQTGATLFVDTNTHLTNGEPNPYFGLPYVSDLESDTFHNPEENDNIRATAAYEFDFTRNSNWTNWLGRHRLMGLWTQQDRKQFATRSRLTAIPPTDPRFINTTFTNANYNYASNGRQVSRRYFYLGEQGGEPGRVTQSAGFWANPGPRGGNGPTDFEIPAYNWNTGGWETANATLSTETWHPGTGGSQRKIISLSGAWQGYFWDDRIVATLGWRKDRYRSRVTPGTAIENPIIDNATQSEWYENGLIRPGEFYNNRWGFFQHIEEETLTKGVVIHALRWGNGSNQLSFHYNESDNFTAPQSATYDFLLNPLANPGGEGKDYGVGVSLFDNKLVARLNWYETSSLNERVSNNLMQRTIRFDTAVTRGWAESVVRYLGGEDITNNFGNASLRPLSTDQQSRVEELAGQPITWPGVGISDTQDLKAEGIELQVIYNPRPNWSIKVTGGSQDTKYSNTNQVWEEWVNGEGARLAFWQSLNVPQAWIDAAPADRKSLTSNVVYGAAGTAATQMNLSNFWSGSYGFISRDDPAIRVDSASGYTAPVGYWQRAVETEIATARQFEGRSQYNQRKWRGNIISNYEFTEGRLRGFAVGGGLRWEDKAIAGYYGTFDRDGNGTVEPNETLMERLDLDRPIYVEAETHLDLWFSYRTKISDKIGMKVQLNIRDALEDGGLTPVYFNLDGKAAAYRIIDPRQIMLTTTFSF